MVRERWPGPPLAGPHRTTPPTTTNEDGLAHGVRLRLPQGATYHFVSRGYSESTVVPTLLRKTILPNSTPKKAHLFFAAADFPTFT